MTELALEERLTNPQNVTWTDGSSLSVPNVKHAGLRLDHEAIPVDRLYPEVIDRSNNMEMRHRTLNEEYEIPEEMAVLFGDLKGNEYLMTIPGNDVDRLSMLAWEARERTNKLIARNPFTRSVAKEMSVSAIPGAIAMGYLGATGPNASAELIITGVLTGGIISGGLWGVVRIMHAMLTDSVDKHAMAKHGVLAQEQAVQRTYNHLARSFETYAIEQAKQELATPIPDELQRGELARSMIQEGLRGALPMVGDADYELVHALTTLPTNTERFEKYLPLVLPSSP